MPSKVKSPKKLKRDLVIPFAGEEQFVVPKRGGFGQPDMEDYVMVTGVRQTTLTSAEEPPLTSTSPVAEPPRSLAYEPMFQQGTITYGNTQVTTTGQTIPPKSTLGIPVSELETLPTTTTTGTTGGIKPIKGIIDGLTPAINEPVSQTSLPPFPNWSTISCSEIASKISYLENLASTQTWSVSDANTLSTQIAAGKSAQLSRCSVPTPTPTPVPVPVPVIPVSPVSPAPPSGGGGGRGGVGGGGGGGGEEPTEAVQVEEKKGGVNWLLILALIGGIWLLSKGRKRN